ncbi:unnamed protein product [Acanthoscelides obtectus]|uniref:Zinc finger protein ZPR1 n=1 Tax=Acanthoscelides obtectus TaxID=200917 RepID=A0A9P0L1W1_ACAOB|nr:unnamed protein product [Acanthoscelides obtectus]CAK1659946.1 Zinc finger protein ZPR1 [Acanthoscelides obtectus]
MGTTKPLFRDINADDPDPETTEIESLCMNCHKTGMTRLLLTKIPFYKEIVVMSFTCEHCGYQNNEIQSGTPVAEKGVRFTLHVKSQEDLNRTVVKSDYTSIKILELDFEIPAKSQKGEITTVEGIMNRSILGLQQDQPIRRIQHSEAAEKIDEFIKKLEQLKTVEKPFTLMIEDISGNSFIENPNAPKVDENCKVHYFVRSKDQDHELGLYTKEEIGAEEARKEDSLLYPVKEGEFTLEDLEGEVFHFPTNCSNCQSPCETNIKLTNIPHFKEVLIMATTCDACGHKTNEVKSGCGVEPKGLKIKVKVRSKDDFSRDVLKSETCSLSIPELELEVGPYALGGRFTTVEGIIQAVKEQLLDSKCSVHMFGDSVEARTKEQYQEFMKKFDDVLDAKIPVTLVLDDPAGNSYIQSMRDDGQPDEGLRIEHYERSFEQNEELGLNDMKTEDYDSS